MTESNLPARVTGRIDQRVPAGQDPSFLGVGFKWPMDVDMTGAIAMSDPIEDLDRSIELIMMTAPGERVMRPKFGCEIWDLLFEPVTITLIGRIQMAVRKAIAMWEPRVDIDNVVPTPDPDDHSLVRISITYTVKSTNDRRNLVYPFYVIPNDTEE